MTKETARSIAEKILQCGLRTDGIYDGCRKTVLHLTKNESNQLYGLLDEIAGPEDGDEVGNAVSWCSFSGPSEDTASRDRGRLVAALWETLTDCDPTFAIAATLFPRRRACGP